MTDVGAPQFSLARLEACEADVQAAERAIAALDDGTYGACARCGDAIAEGVLAGDPLRMDCGAHTDAEAPSPRSVSTTTAPTGMDVPFDVSGYPAD